MKSDPTYYKAARWNGESDDNGAGAVPMTVKPTCRHNVYTGGKALADGVGLDPRFVYCRKRCGFAARKT